MSVSTEDSSRASEVVSRIYAKRGREFISSLEKVLQAVASDKIVRQMLSSQTSGQFITKRIEELFYQIITDDREVFISKIMEKLTAYENVYREEYGEMIKILGNRILSVSDAQNSGALSRMRHIQTLIAQITDLQEEVATLRQTTAEYEATIKELMKTRRLTLFHDLLDDASNHIYAEIDITQLDQKVREMQKDSASATAMIANMKMEFHKMLSKASQSSRDAISMLKQQIEDTQKKYFQENAKVESIQKKYDNHVPKLQKELQNQVNEIETLHTNLAAKTRELKDMKSKNIKAISVIDQMKREHDQLNADLQEHVQTIKELSKNNTNLEDDLNKTKRELSKTQKSVKRIQEQLEEQQHENDEQKTQNAELQSQNNQFSSKIKQLIRDLEKQKSENETLTHDLQTRTNEFKDSQEKLTKQKTVNKELTTKLKEVTEDSNTKAEKIADLEQKLDKKTQEAATLGEKLSVKTTELEKTKSAGEDVQHKLEENIAEEKQKSEKLSRIISNNEKKIEDQNNQINELTQNLEAANKSMQQLKADSKQEAATLNDKIYKLEEEIGNYKKEISDKNQINENLQKNLNETISQRNELKWKVDELEDEISEKNNKIEEAKSSMAAMLLDKEVGKTESQNLHATLEKVTQQNEELGNELRRQKKANEKLTEQNEQLNNQLNTLRGDSTNLTQAVEDANDKLFKSNSMNKQLQAQLSHLSNAAADLSSILSALTCGNVKDALQEINEMKKFTSLLKGVCNLIDIDPRDEDALQRATDISRKLSSLSQIEKLLSTDDAVLSVKQLLNDTEKISKIARCRPGQNLFDAVQTFVTGFDKCCEFIKDVVISLSSSISPTKIEVPLSDARADAVLQSIRVLIKQNADDKANIDSLLSKARSVGYDGSDCLEAAIFIARLKGEQEKQSLLEEMKKQIDQLKEHIRVTEEAHKEELDKKNKAVADLKKTVVQLTEKNVRERDEWQARIDAFEGDISNLKQQLQAEKDLRREIGRIGQGITADKAVLKSKLSAQEFRFLEFIEGVMMKEKESREINEKLKRARQENLQV